MGCGRESWGCVGEGFSLAGGVGGVGGGKPMAADNAEEVAVR